MVADAISRNFPQVLFSQAPEPATNLDSRTTLGHLGDTSARLAVGHLANIANGLISNSLAPSSRKTYSSAQSRYLSFCSHMRINPIPATQRQLILFAADLSQTIAHSSMRTYLAAVRHLHISEGFPDPLSNSLQLDLLMRGAHRAKPASKDQRLPITPLILNTRFSIKNQRSTKTSSFGQPAA